jgi:hypothetical protein
VRPSRRLQGRVSLFRVYAKFLTGGDEEANAKISVRLARRGAAATP